MELMTLCSTFMILSLLSLPQCGVLGQSARNGCNLLYPKKSCSKWYVTLKDGLVKDYDNIYEMQRGFYPIGKFASDRMINVLYNIVLSEEALLDKTENDTCPGVGLDSAMRLLYNRTNAKPLRFLTGWTSSGVFNILTPLQLTKLQLQLSNLIFIHSLIPGSGIYDTSYNVYWEDINTSSENKQTRDLITVNIMNLTIVVDAIECIPDVQLIRSSLIDITIMLKVWASSEGGTPEEINDNKLGYVTEAGAGIEDIGNLVEFDTFFVLLFATISFLLGISSIGIVGTAMPILERQFAYGRPQFYLYYFAMSIFLFNICMVFIVLDFIQMPKWCHEAVYYDSFLGRRVSTGCDATVIAKLLYYFIAIVLSLTAAILSSRSRKILTLQNSISSARLLDRARLAYICSTWFFILAISFGAWALVPTVLQILVYPPIIITLTLMMWANIFWCSLILAIPLLLCHRNRKLPCIVNFYYLSPFLLMVIVVALFIIVSSAYVETIKYGTQFGNVVGIIIAAVPSIGFTLFTEFYRDWFLPVKKPSQGNEDNLQGPEVSSEGEGQIFQNSTAADDELHAIHIVRDHDDNPALTTDTRDDDDDDYHISKQSRPAKGSISLAKDTAKTLLHSVFPNRKGGSQYRHYSISTLQPSNELRLVSMEQDF